MCQTSKGQEHEHAEVSTLRTKTAVTADDFESILQHRVAALELEFAAVTGTFVQFRRGVSGTSWDCVVLVDGFGSHV